MEEQDILNLNLTGYSLGSSCCHREDQKFKKMDTLLHCAEQTLEVCAVELETKSSNFKILALYRAPSANFNQFIGD
jgi:hypothetical protein